MVRTDDDTLAAHLAACLALGRSMDWERDLETRVMKLDNKEIGRVVKKYLHPAALSIISAGQVGSTLGTREGKLQK